MSYLWPTSLTGTWRPSEWSPRTARDFSLKLLNSNPGENSGGAQLWGTKVAFLPVPVASTLLRYGCPGTESVWR